MGSRAVWTEDQLRILRDFFPRFRTKDVATMIGLPEHVVNRKAQTLGVAKTAEYLASPAARRLGRGDEVGKAYRFPKGNKPWNAGTKGVVTGGEQTQFKPGQMPHNTMPIGAYRLDKDGVLQRKIGNGKGSNSVRWRGVHELVWTQANGPLPPKHIVVFKPGMRTNVLEKITIDRVECISVAENMKRNTVHNMPRELVDLVRLRAVLTRSINRKEKNGQPENN